MLEQDDIRINKRMEGGDGCDCLKARGEAKISVVIYVV